MPLFDIEHIKHAGSLFSGDRKYRYRLWRIWDDSMPMVMFIGLNPSTANEIEDDNTIRRVRSIAKYNGYGGVYMMNLFAIVSRDPKILKTCADPVGDNDTWLVDTASLCTDVIFAWGRFKEAKQRTKKVIELFPNAKCLNILKDGSPQHPLLVRIATTPIPFKQ